MIETLRTVNLNTLNPILRQTYDQLRIEQEGFRTSRDTEDQTTIHSSPAGKVIIKATSRGISYFVKTPSEGLRQIVEPVSVGQMIRGRRSLRNI